MSRGPSTRRRWPRTTTAAQPRSAAAGVLALQGQAEAHGDSGSERVSWLRHADGGTGDASELAQTACRVNEMVQAIVHVPDFDAGRAERQMLRIADHHQ